VLNHHSGGLQVFDDFRITRTGRAHGGFLIDEKVIDDG
jgi:hypothetical protein